VFSKAKAENAVAAPSENHGKIKQAQKVSFSVIASVLADVA